MSYATRTSAEREFAVDFYYLDHTHAAREYITLPPSTPLGEVYGMAENEFGRMVDGQEVYAGSVA